MLVLDTSAYLNGWHDHYPRATFPSVWSLIEAALGDGRAISPREVYNELTRQDDDVAAWAKERVDRFVEPTAEVQRSAQLRGWTVVTYEGRTFSGVPTANWQKSMPGICGQYAIACITLPEALGRLGGSF